MQKQLTHKKSLQIFFRIAALTGKQDEIVPLVSYQVILRIQEVKQYPLHVRKLFVTNKSRTRAEDLL